MDEDNSTVQDAPAAPEVVDSPEVVDAPVTTDEQPVTEPSEEPEDAPSGAPETDDKLRKYAENQGIELDSPSAIKAARLAMENQAEKTRNYQKASELEKASQIPQENIAAADDPQAASDARVRNLELKYAVQEWKINNPEKVAAVEHFPTRTIISWVSSILQEICLAIRGESETAHDAYQESRGVEVG